MILETLQEDSIIWSLRMIYKVQNDVDRMEVDHFYLGTQLSCFFLILKNQLCGSELSFDMEDLVCEKTWGMWSGDSSEE